MSPPGGFHWHGGGGGRHMGGDRPAKLPSLRRLYRHFRSFILAHRLAIAIGTACVGVGLVLGKFRPLIVRFLVDNALTPVLRQERTEELRSHSLRIVLLCVGAMLGVALLSALIARLHMRVMRRAGATMVRDLRMHVYNHIQKLSLRFYESRRTGEIMSRLTGDVGAMEHLVTGISDRLLTDVLNLVVTLAILFYLNWQLALVALTPVPILIFLMYRFGKTVRPVYRKVRDQFGQLSAKLQDNLTGIRVIKAFNTEQTETERFEQENRDLFSTQMEEIRLSSNAFPLIRFFDGLGAILVTAVGSYLLLRPVPPITLGDLFAFNAFVMQLYQPIGALFHMYNTVLRSLASGDRIADFLEEEPDVEDRPGATELAAVEGHVRFEGVSFHYTEGTPVLDSVDIDARPGEIVALVGPSGTGKTSIASLIPRFYDPVRGRITIDGHDLREVTQASLRRQIAIVSQDPFLFNGTVVENISYARPEATQEQIREAAAAAYADEFIEQLPQGYQTQIGERGVKLSGGQKQRLAVARALLTDRRILVLDEATSMVDSHAEYLIQKALSRLMKGRTTFVIAHRLSTIKHADTILVVVEGRIVEAGDHESLIRRGGAYAEMYRAQYRLDREYGVSRAESSLFDLAAAGSDGE